MAKKFDFSGVWHCSYHYYSVIQHGKRTSEYDIQLQQIANQVVLQSVPNPKQSYIFARLSRDGNILTGTWHEQTAPNGPYKSSIFYGGLQLVIDEKKDGIFGQWVGFNAANEIKYGEWEIVRLSPTSKKKK